MRFRYQVLATCALTALLMQLAVRTSSAEDQSEITRVASRIFLAVFDADNTRETLIIAVDPANGSWERIAAGNGIGLVRLSPNKQSLLVTNVIEGVWTYTAQAGGGRGRVFDKGSQAFWSSDGREIIVGQTKMGKNESWKHQAWRMKAGGADVTKLTIPETDEINDWSPDGNWVVTVSDRHPPHGSGYQLYVMRADGSDERRITQGPGLNCYARFSPDSRSVVYLHQEDINSIWTVNTDGSNPREILKEDGLTGIDSPCWSPNGKQLALVCSDKTFDDKGRARHNMESPNFRLQIIDLDGSRRELRFQNNLKPKWISRPDWQ